MVVEVAVQGGGVRSSTESRTGPQSFCNCLGSRRRRRKTDSRVETASVVLEREGWERTEQKTKNRRGLSKIEARRMR